TSETGSDLLAEMDLWEVARGVRGQELMAMGIFAKSLNSAREIRTKLAEAVRRQSQRGSSGDRQDILKACVAGMVDHLYQSSYGSYRNGGSTDRALAKESVVTGSPKWVVGLPKDIQFKDRRGYLRTLNLVAMVSAVDPAWLAD